MTQEELFIKCLWDGQMFVPDGEMSDREWRVWNIAKYSIKVPGGRMAFIEFKDYKEYKEKHESQSH